MKNLRHLGLGALVVVLLLGLWWWQRGDAVVPPTTTPRESVTPATEPSTPAAASAATPDPVRSAAVEGLSVRVLDAAGAPAEGVPIRLSASADENGGGAGEHVATGRSDAAGMTAFVNLQQHRRIQYGQDEGREVLAFVVGVAVPGLGFEPVVVVAKPPLPKEPVELRLPPTGSLRLRFLFEGAAMPGLSSVALRAGSEQSAETHDLHVSEVVDDEGWALFRWLPPGVPLLAAPQGFRLGSQARPSEIPLVAPGALLQHQVELGSSWVAVRGRLLGPNGQPLAKESFLVEYKIDNASGYWIDNDIRDSEVLTDARGVFLQFLGQLSEQPTAPLFEFELRSMKRSELRLSVPPRELKAGVNELGDLHFGGEPLVCQGRFEGFSSAPTNYGVSARIEQERIHETTGEATWDWLVEPKVGVGRDGVFVARGVVEPGRYRLRVTAREYLPVAPIEFRVGQQDLVVPLRRALGLTVECLLPEGADAEHLRLDLVGGPAREPELDDPWELCSMVLYPTDNRRGHCGSTRDNVAPFQWSAVEPGTYTLQVSLLGLAEPVHTVPEIVLPPPDGNQRHLPRIDLRAVLRTVRLRLVDGAGQPVEPSGYAFLQPQAGPRWWGTTLAERDTRMLLPMREQTVRVLGEGRRPCSLVVPAGVTSVDVKVETWPHVELSLGPGVVIPDGCDLCASATSDRPRERVPFARSGMFWWEELDAELQPADNSVSLQVGGEPERLVLGDGPHRLWLVLRRDQDERVLQRFSPSEVVAGAPVTITLDAAELAEAAKALAPKEAPK